MPDAPPDTHAETKAPDAQDAPELDLGQQVDEFLSQVERSARDIAEQFGNDQPSSLSSAEIDVDDVIDDMGAVVTPPADQNVKAPASEEQDQDAIVELGTGASDSSADVHVAEKAIATPPSEEQTPAQPVADADTPAPQAEDAELETQVDELIEQATAPATESERTEEAPPPSQEEPVDKHAEVSAAIETPADIHESSPPQGPATDANAESESQAAPTESETSQTTIVEIDEQLADAADEALTDADSVEGDFLPPEDAIDEAPEEDVIEVVSASTADEPEAIVEIESPETPATDPGEPAQGDVDAIPEKAESSDAKSSDEEKTQDDAKAATASSFPKKFAAVGGTGAQTALVLINKPFAKLSPQVRSLIGWVGLVTIFNAVALWIFLLLR